MAASKNKEPIIVYDRRSNARYVFDSIESLSREAESELPEMKELFLDGNVAMLTMLLRHPELTHPFFSVTYMKDYEPNRLTLLTERAIQVETEIAECFNSKPFVHPHVFDDTVAAPYWFLYENRLYLFHDVPVSTVPFSDWDEDTLAEACYGCYRMAEGDNTVEHYQGWFRYLCWDPMSGPETMVRFFYVLLEEANCIECFI